MAEGLQIKPQQQQQRPPQQQLISLKLEFKTEDWLPDNARWQEVPQSFKSLESKVLSDICKIKSTK